MRLASKLPKRSYAKYAAMIDDVEQVAALVRQTLAKIRALEQLLVRVTEAEEKDEVENELSRLRKLMAHQQQHHRRSAAITATIEHWLHKLPPNVTLQTARWLDPEKLRQPGHGWDVSLALVRVEITKLMQFRSEVLRCALPLSDQKARADLYVEKLIGRGKPHVVAEHGRDFTVSFGGDGFVPKPDIAAIMAWLDGGKSLREALHRELDGQTSGRMALSPEDREKQLAETEATLLRLERKEETLIEAAQEGGYRIERRDHASPLAILGVQIAPQRAVAAA